MGLPLFKLYLICLIFNLSLSKLLVLICPLPKLLKVLHLLTYFYNSIFVIFGKPKFLWFDFDALNNWVWSCIREENLSKTTFANCWWLFLFFLVILFYMVLLEIIFDQERCRERSNGNIGPQCNKAKTFWFYFQRYFWILLIKIVLVVYDLMFMQFLNNIL